MIKKSEEQNVTLAMRKDLLYRARILAAKRNTSLSALIRDHFEKLVAEEEGYQQAQEFCIREMERGYYIGARPGAVNREDLHGNG